VRPLGQRKHAHKCPGHGHQCGVCVPVTRKQRKRSKHGDLSVARVGRVRERVEPEDAS
jgi:hypothetical protein